MTYALIPGAGGSAWYWHRVAPLLRSVDSRVIAVDLPAARWQAEPKQSDTPFGQPWAPEELAKRLRVYRTS
jgi:pimeloyl-ACP methyl ester carboxylesterase